MPPDRNASTRLTINMLSRSAFRAVAEFQEVFPSADNTWYGGLSSLVDALSGSPKIVDQAHRALEDMLLQVPPSPVPWGVRSTVSSLTVSFGRSKIAWQTP